jgi:hypothetical protein
MRKSRLLRGTRRDVPMDPEELHYGRIISDDMSVPSSASPGSL